MKLSAKLGKLQEIMSGQVHSEVLEKLCLVCGCFLPKLCYDVEKYKEDLSRAFYLNIEECHDKHIFPQKMCDKCYYKMRNILGRNTTPNSLNVQTWVAHKESCCPICELGSTVRKPGKKAKVSYRTGRPTENTNFWSREHSSNLLAATPPNKLSIKLDVVNMKSENNPQLEMCKCSLCQNIINRPVIIKTCEDCFCITCLLQYVEGKNFSDLKCPECACTFKEGDVQPSRTVEKLLQSLKLSCDRKCGMAFTVFDNLNKVTHEADCQGPQRSFSLMDILKISTSSALPKEAEKVAAHVIRHKMANSTLPNKEVAFCTGSSRVSFYFFN